jgi:signal peptidase II
MWAVRDLRPLGILGGSLIVGGGFSNLVDRIFNRGIVVDFMNMGVGGLRTGIFNVADVAIMAGVGLLLLNTLLLPSLETGSEDDGEGQPP